MQPPRIEAQATVDPGMFEVADRVHHLPFLVLVKGRLTGGDALEDRTYQIAAVDERRAAFDALDRYETEMERVN